MDPTLKKLAWILAIGGVVLATVYCGLPQSSEALHKQFRRAFEQVQIGMTESQVDWLIVGHPATTKEDNYEQTELPTVLMSDAVKLKTYPRRPQEEFHILVYFDKAGQVVGKSITPPDW